MKNPLSVVKALLFIVFFSSSLTNTIYAQNGIIPLSGMKFFFEGITAKTIQVKIDGSQLLSNRIPLNKEIEIYLDKLAGFVQAPNNKTMYAGAELTVLSPRGEVLIKNPDLLIKNYANGFYVNQLNNFSIKFVIGADIVKNNFNGTLKIRLFDAKGKSQLRLEIPVTFARPGEILQVSKNVKSIKANDGVNGFINGLQAKNMTVQVDTTIKVAPKMAYTSMDISNIEGSSLSEMFQGKETFWVYDSDLNEVKITDQLLKKVKGALENNTVNYTLKIPFRLKSNNAKLYTVRYRWESPDKKQIIDVVVKN